MTRTLRNSCSTPGRHTDRSRIARHRSRRWNRRTAERHRAQRLKSTGGPDPTPAHPPAACLGLGIWNQNGGQSRIGKTEGLTKRTQVGRIDPALANDDNTLAGAVYAGVVYR